MSARKCLIVIILVFISACASSPPLPPQPTVSHVDLPRFMGRWYVIASVPTSFESGAFNATETYTWNEKEDRIDIDFRYLKDAFDGKEKKIPQKAFVYNTTTKSEWRVQPFWPLRFAYLIVSLNDDYSETIIGVPNREHVWLLARTPSITEEHYKAASKKIAELGYDISKLKLVPQKW